MSDINSLLIAKVISYMGKMAHICLEDGSSFEGLIKGIQIDGVDIITPGGVITIEPDKVKDIKDIEKSSNEEKIIETLVGFLKKTAVVTCSYGEVMGVISEINQDGVKIITEKGKKSVSVSDIINIRESNSEDESGSFDTVDLENLLVKEVVYGTKESVREVLKDTQLMEELEIDSSLASEIESRLDMKVVSWEHTPFKNAMRCRNILKGVVDLDTLKNLFVLAVKHPDGGKKSAAITEVITIMHRCEAYAEIIEFYKEYETEITDYMIVAKKAYAVAVGETEGAEALSKLLNSEPALKNHSTYGAFFEKFLKELYERKTNELKEQLSGSMIFEKPNSFEEEIISSDIKSAINIASDNESMTGFGYLPCEIDNAVKVLSEFNSEGHFLSKLDAARLIYKIQKNRNKTAESLYIDALNEPYAINELIAIYMLSGEYKKIITISESSNAKDMVFLPVTACGVFLAYLKIMPEKAVTLLKQYPVILVFENVRNAILAEETELFDDKIINTVKEWEADAERMETLSKLSGAQDLFGCVDADLYGLVAYAENIGFYEWCIMLFEAQYKLLSKSDICCNSYAAALFKERTLFEALQAMEPLVSTISDRALLVQIESACVTDEHTKLLTAVREKLDSYELNEFELAVINYDLALIEEFIENKEKMCELGYSEEELQHIDRVHKSMPGGFSNAEKGMRLFRVQENKNTTAERFLTKDGEELPAALRVLFHIYCDEGRYEEAYGMFVERSELFENRNELSAEILDMLYHTDNRQKFLDIYYSEEYVKAKRHHIFCAGILAETDDERFYGILQSLEGKHYSVTDIEDLNKIALSLDEKKKYDKLAGILCVLFGNTSKSCNKTVYTAIAGFGNLSEESKQKIAEEARLNGYDMQLPSYWAATGTNFPGSDFIDECYKRCIEEVSNDINASWRRYRMLADIFPQKISEIYKQRFDAMTKNEDTTDSPAMMIQELYEQGEAAVILVLLNEIAEGRCIIDEELIEALNILCGDGYKNEIIKCLIGYIKNKYIRFDECKEVIRFISENVELSELVSIIDKECYDVLKTVYMKYAGGNGSEKVRCLLYEFLYAFDDTDADILAVLMRQNRKMWTSYANRAEFERKIGERKSDPDSLKLAFFKALESYNPLDIEVFVKKWHNFSEKTLDEAKRELQRMSGEHNTAYRDMDDIICCVISQYRKPDVWRKLYELIAKNNPVVCGNILHCIAISSMEHQDMRDSVNFAMRNNLDNLFVYMTIFELNQNCDNERFTKIACRNVSKLCEDKKVDKLPENIYFKVADKLLNALGKCTENNSSQILTVAREISAARGMTEHFLTNFYSYIKKNPRVLISVVISLYNKYERNADIAQKARAMLEEFMPDGIDVKNFVLDITKTPQTLKENDIAKAAASVFMDDSTRINVYKMQCLIVKEIVKRCDTTDGVKAGIEAAELISTYFPGDALVAEALYYLMSSQTVFSAPSNEDAEKMYECLYSYIMGTNQTDELQTHYVKRLICGLYYLKEKGIIPDGQAPKSVEDIKIMFGKINGADGYMDEIEQFLYITEMLRYEEKEIYQELLLGGFTGNWRPMIRAFGNSNHDRSVRDVADFVSNLGKFNFLRSVADIIINGEEWEKLASVLTRDEFIQLKSIEYINISDELKSFASRLTSCTILDKTGSDIFAQCVFELITPEEFAELLPVMRVMIFDSSLMARLSEISCEYSQRASEKILASYENIPDQIYVKGFRDFLRSFSNMLFDNRMYEAAYPILGLIFYTDLDAQKYSQENMIKRITHDVYRQKMKFCGLTFKEMREVNTFCTSTEYNKHINIFAVMFAMVNPGEIERIAPLMTLLKKKLCVAVYYAAVNRVDDFEITADEISRENADMAEYLYWYGIKIIRDKVVKDRLYRKLRDKNAQPPYFITPAPHESVKKLDIFKALSLKRDSVRNVMTETKSVLVIKSEEYKAMNISLYACEKYADRDEAMSFDEAITRFSSSMTVENAAAVIEAYDIEKAPGFRLAQFFHELSMLVYLEVKNSPVADTFVYAKDVIRCLEAIPVMNGKSAAKSAEVILSIICGVFEFEEFKEIFKTSYSRILSVISDSADHDTKNTLEAINFFFDTVSEIFMADPLLEAEEKIDRLDAVKTSILNNKRVSGDDVFGQLAANLLYMIESEEKNYKNIPILKVVIDRNESTDGGCVTGYVQNCGMKKADDVSVRIGGKQRTYEGHIKHIYPSGYAPFGFKAEMENSCDTVTVMLTYSFDGVQKVKNCGEWRINEIPKSSYAVRKLSADAVNVEDMDSEFIGRSTEIRKFENEFYDLEEKSDGTVEKCIRPVGRVQSMVVSGPKRVGKSSMLHRIEKIVLEMPDAWTCVYVDAMARDSLQGIFIHGFASAWSKRYGDVENDEEYKKLLCELPSDGNLSIVELERFYRKFRDIFAPGKKMLFIIDEIERAINVSSAVKVFDILQYITKNMTDIMSFIICGSDSLVGLMFDMEGDTQFFQIVKPFNIARMPRNEFDELIEAFNEQSGLVPDKESVEELWRLTKGQVYYTKEVYNRIVDIFREKSGDGERNDVHLYHVYEAFLKMYDDTNTFFGVYSIFKKNDVYTDEGKVMNEIARNAKEPEMSVPYAVIYEMSDDVDIDENLKRLCARTFIEGSVGSGYRFASEMYRVVMRNSSPAELYFKRLGESRR